MAHKADALPGVSYVMPVLNEVEHIEAAITSLLTQDYAGPFEVVLALGPSVDGTTEVIAALAADDPRIRSIPNELGSTPGGLNAAIRASSFPVVVRVDAHSVLPPDYTRVAVDTLLATGADNVGGIMRAEGSTPFQRAVAHAYGSPFGLGGTQHHVGGKAGPADTAYLGVFRRERLVEVGLFDEGIKRGQDWELNRRLRATGGTVWFTPELVVAYRPRSSLTKLLRQFVATGIWRGELARRFGTANSIRYFVPPVAVLGIVVTFLLGIAGIIAEVPWLLLGFAIPVFYVICVIAAAVQAGAQGGGRAGGPTGGRAGAAVGRNGVRVGLWYLVVLPCIHFGWGIGFLLGFFSLTRNITEQTGR